MGGTAESVVIPVTIQVSGEDKVKSLTRTLEKLSKGANFNKYWGSYQNIIDGVTASFEQYTNALSRGDKATSNNFGKEMIKNLNALDAALELSGKKIEDFDFKGFDIKNIRNTATELMKNTDMENIGLKFSKDNFKDFGVALEYMKSFSGEIGNVFDQLSRSSSDNTIIKQLQEDAVSAKEAISDLKNIIEEQKTELQSFESGEKFSQMTDDYEKAMNDLERAERKLGKIKETAKSEFKAFLDANNLDSDEHYGDFAEYFEQIERGYLKSSQEAIRALKGSQDAYLLGQNMDIDTTQLQQFIAMLEKCVSSVAEVKSEVTQLADVVNTLGTKAPLENLADSISKSEDITEEQRAKLTAMANGSQDLNSVAQIISVISSTSKEAEGSMEGFYNTITQLVEALQGLANVNFDSLKKIGGIFESITSLNGFNTKESSFTALLDFLTKLNELEATGNAKLFSGLDFSSLNNIKIKPETSNSIVSLIDAMNGANLSGVNNLNLEWLEKLKIGKTALNSLTSLKEFLNDIRDIDTSGLSTASGLNFDWVEKLSIKSGALKSLEQLKGFLNSVNGSDLSNLESSLKNVKFDEISKYINENIKPIDTSKLIGDTGISAESGALTSLISVIDQVIEAVGRKNNAFLEEQSVVTSVVDSELTALGTLWATIDDIATAAKGIDPGKMFSTQYKLDLMTEKKKQATTKEKSVDDNISYLEKLYKAEDGLIKKRQKNGSLTNTETFDLRNIQQEIAKTEALVQGEEKYQTLLARRQAMQKDTVADYNNKINDTISSANKILENNKSSDFIESGKYIELKELIPQLEQLRKADTDIISDQDVEQSTELLNNARELISLLNGKSAKINSNKGTFLGKIGSYSDIDDAKRQIRELVQAQAESKNARFIDDGFSKNNTQLNYRLITADGTVQHMSASWDAASNSITGYMRKETEYVSQGQQFINSVKGKFAELTRYISVMDVVQKGIQFLKSGISSVVDINTAMTELKKVTDETAGSYERFGKTAGDIATEVGTTRKEITNSTADFARLGYSMEDSTKLAKSAAIYKNVGDGIDIDTATENIISTLRGFQQEVDDVPKMIDIFNEVSNNTPIDAGGLGEALKRSASAFNAANTDMNEAISLIVGANSVVQNPEKVGNMWKTVSMRIRGAKVELEEAGEDTDDLVTSTSEMRDLVKGITGFDIMKDKDTFKNMKDIIVGIGKEWDNISDIDRTALLNKLAGKTQANALAAAFDNYKLIEETYQYTQNAEGSATEENAKYLDSIEGRIQILNTSFQNLWANAVDDGFLSFWIDLGTNILNVVDKIGMFKTAIGAALGIASFNGAGRANFAI